MDDKALSHGDVGLAVQNGAPSPNTACSGRSSMFYTMLMLCFRAKRAKQRFGVVNRIIISL